MNKNRDKVWNVKVPVVCLVGAATGDEAIGKLAGALRAAGFEVYDDPAGADAFESEGGTEASELPAFTKVSGSRGGILTRHCWY